MKLAVYAGMVLVVLLFTSLLIVLAYPELYLNQYFKNKIIKEFNSSYPDYSVEIADLKLNVFKNRIELKSVAFKSADSSFDCRIDKQSLSGVAWLQLLWKGDLAPDIIAGSVVDSKNIVIRFVKSQYEVSCSELNVSMYKSEIVLKDLKFLPLVDDNLFFNQSIYRKTRFSMNLPQIKVTGLSYFGLKKEFVYHARFIEIGDVAIEIANNTNKSAIQEVKDDSLPKTMISSIKKILNVDSLIVSKIKIYYADFYSATSKISSSVLSSYNSGHSINISDLKFNINDNNIRLASVGLNSDDKSIACEAGSSSLSGISWFNLAYNGKLLPIDLKSLVVKTEHINLNIAEDKYYYTSGPIHLSLKDSTLAANNLKLETKLDEMAFFNSSKYRKTKLNLTVPKIKMSGVDYQKLLGDKSYFVRSIQAEDASIDILVNMYKPYKSEKVKPLMLNEMMASTNGIIKIDNIDIKNGKIIYKESYSPSTKPAVINFDKMNLSAQGISNNNNNGNTVLIQANSNFMSAGKMQAALSIPLTSKVFSMKYSGSLGRMELDKLNSFLENSEHKRINSGIVETANFEINVKNGRATGSIKANYKDLKLAFLDSKKSDNGILNQAKSFLANNFKLHGTNKPDKSGEMKSGKVAYKRMRDDTFTQFLWFALRTGLADIVGF